MCMLAIASCDHVHKDWWIPIINEKFACQREPGNIHNRYGVSVTKKWHCRPSAAKSECCVFALIS